jgi:hypothetical protein
MYQTMQTYKEFIDTFVDKGKMEEMKNKSMTNFSTFGTNATVFDFMQPIFDAYVIFKQWREANPAVELSSWKGIEEWRAQGNSSNGLLKGSPAKEAPKGGRRSRGRRRNRNSRRR